MRYVCLIAAAAALFVFGTARPAPAIQQFYNAFVDEYVKTSDNKKFVDLVQKEAKCLICHQGAKSKKNRNAFGKEVAKLLKKSDQKDTEKIAASLKKALAVHVDPKNDKSETYLDRIKAGKLPGGDLEALKKEPADEGKK